MGVKRYSDVAPMANKMVDTFMGPLDNEHIDEINMYCCNNHNNLDDVWK